MEPKIVSRLKKGWNAFINNKDPTVTETFGGYSTKPDRMRFSKGNERSIVTSVFNRIALDAASMTIRHVELDENDRYIATVDSGLNRCFNLEANLDQTGRSFLHDAFASLLDEGCIALVPTDTSINLKTGVIDIDTLRVGKILTWYPAHVKVSVYNEQIGRQQEITVPKKTTAIIENPFFAVMNESNSTSKRLIRKLNLLDAIDEQSGSGKLDLIMQLPYTVRTEARKKQAAERLAEIELQLTGSKYGIAYADATERITQLNRPIENNLLSQIEYLTNMLYSQLSITKEIMDGTAPESVMTNYFNRTIEVIVSALVDECKRKFLNDADREANKSIMWFRDAFKLIPISQLPEMADKLKRNEILSSNEVRQIMGFKPSEDPKADELKNSNNVRYDGQYDPSMDYEDPSMGYDESLDEQGENQNGEYV